MDSSANAPESWPWLIAGQGLAGSVLALELARRGQAVHVVDAGLAHAASPVAAGAFNPVTGKRMQLTWQAAELWPRLERFYPQAELLLGARFFFALPNLRPLFTAAERADAEKMARSGALSPWIRVADALPWAPADQVHAPFGAILVERAGFVEVPVLCQAVRQWLVEAHAYTAGRVEAADLQPEAGGLRWQGRPYRGLIWADGYAGAQNPALAGLPLAPLKGEILLVETALSPTLAGAVLNRAAYLAPRPDGRLWAGSTYEHQFQTQKPTQANRDSILERVGRFYMPALTVVKHLSGIRPSVRDRRPILGPLPGGLHQYAFTGLGTKGVSLSPWMAELLADHLLEGNPIPPEVAVRSLEG